MPCQGEPKYAETGSWLSTASIPTLPVPDAAGQPYYTAKAETLRFNPDLDRRHGQTGQPVRQFLRST